MLPYTTWGPSVEPIIWQLDRAIVRTCYLFKHLKVLNSNCRGTRHSLLRCTSKGQDAIPVVLHLFFFVFLSIKWATTVLRQFNPTAIKDSQDECVLDSSKRPQLRLQRVPGLEDFGRLIDNGRGDTSHGTMSRIVKEDKRLMAFLVILAYLVTDV